MNRVYDLIADSARKDPEAPALIAADGGVISYAQLLERIASAARRLRALGLEPGHRVAIVLPNGVEAATSFLAATSVAVACPLNPGYRRAEFDFYLSDLGVRALVVCADDASEAREAARALGITIVDDLARHSRAVDTAAFEPSVGASDVALVLHTSGTTARPKIVPLTHENLCVSAMNIARGLALSPHDRCLGVMPLFHIHGLVGALLASLAAGGSVVCTAGFVATEFARLLRERAATWYTAVPAMHQAILSRARLEPAPPPLRLVRSSSAALAPRTAEELARLFDAPVIEAYGMTEAAHQICSNPLARGAQRYGSVGVAAGPEVVLLDERGDPVPCGTVGEVALRGPSVMRGYENVVADAQPGTWFRTGDLGRFDADGYLYLTGRIKEIINRGGEKISPREIDDVLLEHPAVAQAVAFAIPDDRVGEEIGAAVVLHEAASVDERALTAFVAQRVADFKVPRLIAFVDRIPVGPSGKLQRFGLASALNVTAASFDVAPSAESHTFEEPLATIWRDLLRVDAVGRDDDFFALGGDSILAVRMVARVRDDLRRELPVTAIFRRSRLAQVAASLAASPPAKEMRAAVVRGGAYERLASAGERRMWLFERVNPQSRVYHNVHLVHVRGPLDAPLLTTCFAEIVRRHDALRTRFVPAGPHDDLTAYVAPDVRIDVAPIDAGDAFDTASRATEIARELAYPPFDLRAGPLVRSALVRFSATHHVLVLVVHHIVWDRWSLGVLLRELATLYGAHGDARALAALPNGAPDEELSDVDLAYWRTHLGDDPQVLAIPPDRPRPAQPTYRGAVFVTTLDADLLRAIEHIGARERATPFVTYLAAFSVLLQRWTRQSDVLIGTPVAGRTRSEDEPMLGLFVNTLPLRIRAAPKDSFRALLANVRGVVLDVLAHQAIPFDRLVNELRGARDPSRNPFFDVLFDFHNTPRGDVWPAELDVACDDVDLHISRLDLTFVLRPEADGSLTCRFEYSHDVFEAATIAAFAAQFHTLLEAIVRDPDGALDGFVLTAPSDRATILRRWSVPDDPLVARPAEAFGATVHALVEATAARSPHAPALVDERGTVTYRELDERANRLARALRARGVGRGSAVALFLDRSATTIVAMLAVLKAGAAYVPVDPAYPAERVAAMLAVANVRTILAQRDAFETLAPYQADLLDPSDVGACETFSSAVLRGDVAAGDVAYIMFTSGSTGTPKGVAITHRGIVALVTETPSYACETDDVFLLHAALTFDASTALWAPLASGARVAVMPAGPFALAEFGAALRAFGVTIVDLTPALFHQLVAERAADLRGLRRCLVGGDVLSPEMSARFLRDVPGCRLFNDYGPTETTVIACSHEISAASTQRATVPIGRPIARARTYVLDAYREPLPACVPGELWIGGDGVARGYVGDDALTADRFRGDPFADDPGARMYRTGDIVRYAPNGDLEFLGRSDEQVKIRGFRIEPAEIEFRLLAHPRVRAAAVVVLGAGAERGLVAYVQTDLAECAEAELRAFVQTKLPPHAVPARIVALAALPMSPGGKLDRRALAALPLAERAPDHDDAPVNDIERRVAQIVREVLGLASVGRSDDFFFLGGHSLLATRAIARIFDAFGVEVSLRAFFGAPTVAGLARLVEAAPPASRAPSAGELEAHLATLSDADVDRMLSEMLAPKASAVMRCVLIGRTSLVLRCADIVRAARHDVVAVIGHPAPEHALADTLRRHDVDYVFSVIHLGIVPAHVLALAKRGAINLHDAPLPRYAGLHATTWAIAAGERTHGVTWHDMTAVVDAGPILASRLVEIAADDTAFSLNLKCYDAAAESFGELVAELANGTVVRREQDLGQRTYFSAARRPSPGCLLDWSRSAAELDAFVRALSFERSPNPLGRPVLFVDDAAYACGRLRCTAERVTLAPGTIVRIDAGALFVAAGAGEIVALSELTSFGGVPLAPRDLAARHALAKGARVRTFDDMPLDAIARIHATTIAAEPYWLARFDALSPLVLPEFDGVGEGPCDATTVIETGDAEACAVLTAFASHLLSDRADGAFDIGFSHAGIAQPAPLDALFAQSVPLRIDVSSLSPVSLATTIDETARRGTFAVDLCSRYPHLSRRTRDLREGVLPVVASFDGAGAVRGARLTLALGDGRALLHYRFSDGAQRAAQALAEGTSAFLGVRA